MTACITSWQHRDERGRGDLPLLGDGNRAATRSSKSKETIARSVLCALTSDGHTGICLRTLPSVFDVRRRPWVDLQGAEASAVADAVARCPTGALRYERLDGAGGERPQRPTAVWPIEDGPLLMVGDLEVRGPDGEPVTHETRLTLCRCGLSHNQPFCDNSHRRRKWKSGPSIEPPEPRPRRGSMQSMPVVCCCVAAGRAPTSLSATPVMSGLGSAVARLRRRATGRAAAERLRGDGADQPARLRRLPAGTRSRMVAWSSECPRD